MSLLRWFALVFMFLLQAIPQAALAQETSSTPGANRPVPIAAVQRDFEVNGFTVLGPSVVATFIFVYDTPEEAIAEFPILHEFYRDRLEETGGKLQPASTPKLGDERKAYAGSYIEEEREGSVGIFAWREGSRVYILAAAGLAGDMLTPLFDLGSSLSGRDLPDSQPDQATSSDEMSSGGAYELLPTLDDIPPGLVFAGDTDLLAEETDATPEP